MPYVSKYIFFYFHLSRGDDKFYQSKFLLLYSTELNQTEV
jgi:hypothetical protein